MAKAVTNSANSEFNKEEGMWIIPEVEEAQVNDLQMSITLPITHPANKGPNIILKEYDYTTRVSKQK